MIEVFAFEVGDVNPEVFLVGGLPNDLVELAVVDNPLHPFATGGGVGYVDVGCMACQMHTVGNSSYEFVEDCAAIAGTDGDGNSHCYSERFEDVDAELAEVVDDSGFDWVRLGEAVVDVGLLSCGTLCELGELEMLG